SDPINPIFTSYDRSSVTGLDYAINRHYDPLQRFTQVDPAGIAATNLRKPQTLNLYSYAINDPINRSDTNGLQGEFPWGSAESAGLKFLPEGSAISAFQAGYKMGYWFGNYYGNNGLPGLGGGELTGNEPGAGTPGPG